MKAVIQQVTQTFLPSQVPDQLVQAGNVPDARNQQSRTIFLGEHVMQAVEQQHNAFDVQVFLVPDKT